MEIVTSGVTARQRQRQRRRNIALGAVDEDHGEVGKEKETDKEMTNW